ncbi:MAG: presqualene diphosphate synthase HpnD [Rhizobiales bacterium]|nr:presqualene diphosphate synthase HpnD [Hyphomicrobiales bacterium]
MLANQPAAATRASGSSFYTAMRVLPRPQREAMFEIYAFCRAVDDIADSDDPRPVRHAQLARWRLDIDRLFSEAPPLPLQRLAQVTRSYELARDDFLSVIDGMEMDVEADIRAPTFTTLDLYCDHVASAVGRLSVQVFGMERDEGRQLAHHLGRALQFTNILRDLDEDAAVGRLYLPHEALHQVGISTSEPATVLAHPALGDACAFLVARAQTHFAEADTVMAQARRSTVRAPRVMAEVYRAMLDRMVARGWCTPRRRVRAGRLHLIWILLRHGIL